MGEMRNNNESIKLWRVVLATNYEIYAKDSNEAIDEAFLILKNTLLNESLSDSLGANAELIG